MNPSSPFVSLDLQKWKNRLESDARNPLKVSELFRKLPSGIEISPVYDTASYSSELTYLSEFHREWKQQKQGWKPVLKVSSLPCGNFSPEDTAAAEKLGFSAWSGNINPAGHQLPVEDELSEDPITESLLAGSKTEQLKALFQGILPDRIRIRSAFFHRAGANEAEDLAYCLCLAAHYRDLMGENEFSAILPRISVHLAISSEFFLEIARMRALRLLWMNFTSQCGAGKQAGNIQAETSLLTWSQTDPDGNLLRHTSQVLSATMGGADAILIHPHHLEPETAADSIRLAADIGHLALEEARLQHAFDPGSGSYLIEILTHELARKAWELFCAWQEISLDEKLNKGFFPSIAEKGAERLKREFESKTRILTGVNLHPSPLAKRSPAYPPIAPSGISFPALKPIFLDA